jgi:hypothetical protein
MKRVVLFSVIMMMSAAGFAQRMLQTSTNSYLNADKMVKQQINYPERISREKCHDMSDAEVLNKKYTVSYRVKNDSFPNRLTCIENGTQYHYELRVSHGYLGIMRSRASLLCAHFISLHPSI